jgi:hypothetical protein
MAFALRQSAPEKSFRDARLGVSLALLIASPGSYTWLIVAVRYRQARVSVASIGRDLRSRAYRILTPILACFLVVAAPESAIAEKPDVRPITIRIRVEASSLPKDVDVEAMVAMFFKQAGFTTVAASASDYDAGLEIQVKGTPLSERYRMSLVIVGTGDTHYSGAVVDGTLLLESSKTSSTKQFSGRVAPPYTIEMDSYQTPEKAPFSKALNESNLYVMLGRAVAEVLGVESVVAFWLGGNLSGLTQLKVMGAAAVPGLVRALGGSETLRASARRALTVMGPDAVEPLLAELKQASGESRIGVINLLGENIDTRATPMLTAFLTDTDP